MLVIRMQRTGRKGHAQFRIVVQDSHVTPTSGKVVAQLGSYNPHSKTVILNKDVASKFIANGAQPSERAARVLVAEGLVMPSWVGTVDARTKSIKNLSKLRRNKPAEEVVPELEVAAAESESQPAEDPASEPVAAA